MHRGYIGLDFGGWMVSKRRYPAPSVCLVLMC
nr:MAG TPA: hypothetical protein [Caudoviricetes sp.]